MRVRPASGGPCGPAAAIPGPSNGRWCRLPSNQAGRLLGKELPDLGAAKLALEERTRDRVPLQWAMTQNNLGAALETLGARESGTAQLEAAVAAYRAALEVFIDARADYYANICRNNRDRALAILAERTK